MSSISRSVDIVLGAILMLIAANVSTAHAQPADYYDTADGLTGQALVDELHEIIDDHDEIPYISSSFDTGDAMEIIDEDPDDSDNVILMYSGSSVAKSSYPDWNREHLWPVSLGATEGTVAYSDIHNLHPCDAGVNSTRSNLDFGNCEFSCSSPTDAPDVLYNFAFWEPPDEFKGDVARAVFYMYVRYNGDEFDEPDLDLVNFDATTGCDCLSMLDTLLAWHLLDPVSQKEIDRNDDIYDLIQGNRNPFVDNPDYVGDIWELPEVDGDLWINEVHYDNSGADVDEGVEIAGPAGTSLTAWTLVLYNGSDDEAYGAESLSGEIDDEGDGFGALWFPVVGLQNGGSDGIALIAPDGSVIEFLSYEGTLTALDGAASGLTSTDIGVEEVGAPVDESLQRTGNGASGSDFDWTGPVSHSRGLLNVDQTLAQQFVRGDCDGDLAFSLSDAIAILDVLFAGLPTTCADACDADHDGVSSLADAIYALVSLFLMGADPEAPFPDCGIDSEGADSLGCESAGC